MTQWAKGFVTSEALYRQHDGPVDRQWNQFKRRLIRKAPEVAQTFQPVIFSIEGESEKERVWTTMFFEFTEDKPPEFILKRLLYREYRKMKGEYIGPAQY